MTQEDKELLLKDLCARLPYGVKVNVKGFYFDYNDKLTQIYKDVGCSIQVTTNMPYGIEQVKPYLFPLSSMTEEQKEEYCSLQQKVIYNSKGPINLDVMEYINWCYKNHIDVNNLIPMELAIDATNLNIY